MRLPCVFCKDGAGKAGKLLKCLHKICLDCLSNSIQQDGWIRCSKCRRTTPCPPPGRSHRQVLVDDSMFDKVPDSHDGTTKTNDKCIGLQIADESMNPSSIPQETASSHEVRSTVVDAYLFHKPNHHHGRAHLCPFHINMELRYYCNRCREVLCETCKAQIKHASHIDQVNDATETAAALRQRLMELLRIIFPEDKEKEVNEGLEYARDLLTAFECYSASQVSSIKTMIHEQCQDLLLNVKKRKHELRNGVEFRKEELVELQECNREWNSATGAVQHILEGQRHALTNEDLVKLHPHSIQLLSQTSRGIVAKRRSLTRRITLKCKKLSELKRHLDVMGKVVDNTDIDLSSCCFIYPSSIAVAGERFVITARVRNGQGQPLSEAALKVSSIQIWATRIGGGFSPSAPVQVLISACGKGEVHAEVQLNCSQPTAFLLELMLDTPCILPAFKNGSMFRNVELCHPLTALVHVFRSWASVFHPMCCSPRESMRAYPLLTFISQASTFFRVRQVRDGVATARGSKPIQNRDFAVAIIILNCPCKKLDIGFTWDCAETSQEMKLVLASSANSHSSSTPIRNLVIGDLIHVTRCANTQCKYNIDHYDLRSGLLKNNHSVRIDSSTKPILMVRMFHCDTRIDVFEFDKQQINKSMQEIKPF